MTLHTSTKKGKRILIILKNGDKIIGKFKDKKSGYIITEEHGKIATSIVKSMTICKQTTPRASATGASPPAVDL